MSNENRFLEDFDSYWDEIERVSISRVLNDSVLKEMIKSICEEANERIASKEREILFLNKKLNSFNLDFGMNVVIIDSEIEKAVLRVRQDLFETGLDLSLEEKLGRFRDFMERQIETLKGEVENENFDAVKKVLNFEFEKLSGLFGFLKSTVFEKRWEHELQKEVSSIVFRSYFERLHDEFQFKLHGQIDALRCVQHDWENKVSDFNTLREELNSISKSLLESEICTISKVNNDLIGTNIGAGMEEDLEVHLKHLSKDETINYFKSEITKMKRQNEVALAEKTEELFKLKREFLKERGSISFRKDKDFEFLRVKLPEIIAKMDEFALNEVKWPSINVDQREEIRRLEGKMDFLLSENKNLRDLVEKTKNEVKKLYSSKEGYLAKIEKLSAEIKNLNILGDVRDMVNRTALEEAFELHKCKIEDIRVQMEKSRQKCFVQEKPLTKVDEEIEKLKEILSFLMNENEKLALGLGIESRLEKQRNKIELIMVEIEMLREKSKNQMGYILDLKGVIEINKNKLDEVLKQVSLYEMEIQKQRDLICRSRGETQMVLLPFVRKEKEGEMLLHFVSDFVKGISNKFAEFENILQESIETNENRLAKLSSEFSRLVQQVNQLRKNEMRNRQTLQIRTSNLEKAEAEVDLLGDEVDALLNLLGHIYIALDHYSPVFVHYPGVTEILKLVKSELQVKNI